MPSLKPVVFIPGYPATELWYAPERWRIFPPSLEDLDDPRRKARLLDLLGGVASEPPGSIIPGDPILSLLGVAKQAASLYAILHSNFGYDAGDGSTNFAHVGWDWRKGIDDAATVAAVKGEIEQLSALNGGARVIVIAHSTGGLVLRNLIESHPDLVDRIDEILTFGVPWAGTLKALHALSAGDAEGVLFWRINAQEARRVAIRTQTAYDLVPPDPAKTDMHDIDGAPMNFVVRDGRPTAALTDTSWMTDPVMTPLALRADQRLGRRRPEIDAGGRQLPRITNVAGWGFETMTQCDLHDDGSIAFASGPAKAGDGTVPLASASWLRGPSVRTMMLPIGVYETAGYPYPHARIWDAPPVLQLFGEVLQGRVASPFVCAAADSDDAVDPHRAIRLRVTAQKGDGSPLPECVATIRLRSGDIRVAFNAAVRADIVVTRVGLQANATRDLARFEVEVRWTGGKRVLPVVVHTA